MSFIIRQETKADYATTEQVIKKAFETAEMTDHQEHHLVEKLRQSDAFITTDKKTPSDSCYG